MFKKIVSKKIVIISAILLASLFLFFQIKNGNAKETHTVERGDVVRHVMATGKVVPKQDVELGFDRSGRVSSVNFVVGDSVKRGSVIALLDSTTIDSEIRKARSALEEERIKLKELQNAVPVSFDNASKSLEIAIRDAYIVSDNAVRNRADQFFKNVPNNPTFEVSFEDGNFVHLFPVSSSIQTDINISRKSTEDILNNWNNRLNSISSENILDYANLMSNDLNYISSFIDKVADAINTFTPVRFQYENTINNYKTNMSLARSEVGRTKANLITAKENFNSISIVDEGGKFKDILVQEARVEQAKASLESLEASLNKISITAPFDGIITRQDAKVGTIISQGNSLVSITSQNNVHIEANISEINIGRIKEGNPVLIEFDAFPNEVFGGFVSFIEPGDFLIGGVVNFKIRVELNTPNPKIKNGLTSNLKIETDKRAEVLRIPLYTVFKDLENNFVNKRVGGNFIKTPVSLGISGDDSFVEVLDGLSEGDILEY